MFVFFLVYQIYFVQKLRECRGNLEEYVEVVRQGLATSDLSLLNQVTSEVALILQYQILRSFLAMHSYLMKYLEFIENELIWEFYFVISLWNYT